MSPFYDRLPHVDTAGFEFTADRLGLTIVAATAAGFALHGAGKAVQHRVGAARDAREAAAQELGSSSGPPGIPGSAGQAGVDGEGFSTGGDYGDLDSKPDGR